jgi:16S rRNA (guanine966-N2)-methyltransferase
MLASRMGGFDELRVADLFAGSGALGFEAMSRGAAATTFVEKDAVAIGVIRRNAAKLGADVEILPGSALSLPRGKRFDLILADPPYDQGHADTLVRSVLAADWLTPGGWMSIETSRADQVDPGALVIDTVRDVGRARLTLLRRP